MKGATQPFLLPTARLALCEAKVPREVAGRALVTREVVARSGLKAAASAALAAASARKGAARMEVPLGAVRVARPARGLPARVLESREGAR